MPKSIQMFAAAMALIVAAAMLLASPSQRVAAQSAATFVAAVDLDIVPAEIAKFMAALKENGAASVKEPGCREFKHPCAGEQSQPRLHL